MSVFYLLLVICYLFSPRETLVRKHLFLVLLLIWSTYLFHLPVLAGNSLLNGKVMLKPIVYILVSTVNMVLIRHFVSFSSLARFMNKLSGLLVVIGVWFTITGNYSLFGFQFEKWWAFRVSVPVAGKVAIPQLTSVFTNPNQLSFILLVGFICAIWEYYERMGILSLSLLLTNTLGIYLNHSRAAIAAAFVGGSIFVMFLVSKEAARLTSMGAVLAVLLFMAVVIVTPEKLPIFLGGRKLLWDGAYQAFTEQPIFGYGPIHTGTVVERYVESTRYGGKHPHNSFIRFFLTGGLVGGVFYLVLSIGVIVHQMRKEVSLKNATLLALLVAIFLNQSFEIYSAFGLHTPSLVTGILYGYVISEDTL
jgi:O-antigen ligase